MPVEEVMPSNKETAMAPAGDRPSPHDENIVASLWEEFEDAVPVMIEYYLEDSPVYIQKIMAALGAGEMGAIAAPAHAMKS